MLKTNIVGHFPRQIQHADFHKIDSPVSVSFPVIVKDENSSSIKIFSLSGTNLASLKPFTMLVWQKAVGYANPAKEAASYIMIGFPELLGSKLMKGPKINLSSDCIL